MTAAACVQIFAFLTGLAQSGAGLECFSPDRVVFNVLDGVAADMGFRRRRAVAGNAQHIELLERAVGHERNRLDRAQADRVGERQLPGQAADHGVERIDAHAFFGVFVEPDVFGGNVLGWTIDEKTSFRVLDAFLDLGFNAIDTADVYSAWASGNKGGESETIIGKWLKGRAGIRDKVTIFTKVGSDLGVPGKKGLSEK